MITYCKDCKYGMMDERYQHIMAILSKEQRIHYTDICRKFDTMTNYITGESHTIQFNCYNKNKGDCKDYEPKSSQDEDTEV